MTIHAVFNYWEGWFGIILGAFVLAVSVFKQRRVGWFSVVLFLLLATFGLSDFVEIQTGAWYRPWWLLAWKGFCVAGFLWMWYVYRKRK
jgi:hypothetical protein